MSFREDILNKYGSLPSDRLIESAKKDLLDDEYDKDEEVELGIATIEDYQYAMAIALEDENRDEGLFRLNRGNVGAANFLSVKRLKEIISTSKEEWIVLYSICDGHYRQARKEDLGNPEKCVFKKHYPRKKLEEQWATLKKTDDITELYELGALWTKHSFGARIRFMHISDAKTLLQQMQDRVKQELQSAAEAKEDLW